MSERCEVYVVKLLKARQAHTCAECKRTIPPGERYNSHHGIHDKQAFREPVCLRCDLIRREIDATAETQYELVPLGGLRDAVYDFAQHGPASKQAARWLAHFNIELPKE
jgi:hypothetical protein